MNVSKLVLFSCSECWGKLNSKQSTHREEVKHLIAWFGWRRDWGDHYIPWCPSHKEPQLFTQHELHHLKSPIAFLVRKGHQLSADNEEDPRSLQSHLHLSWTSTCHSALRKIPNILNLIFGESYQGIWVAITRARNNFLPQGRRLYWSTDQHALRLSYHTYHTQ